MIVAVFIVIATVVICLAGTIGVMLIFHTLRIRTAFAIPAQPMLVPTTTQQIPPDLAAFLAQVVPALHALGFVTVASVNAPQMIATITWTQVLFLRRDRGDRASVMLLRPDDITGSATSTLPPALIFATELPDGRSVKTATSDKPQPPGTFQPDAIVTLYQQHRTSVAQSLGVDAQGVTPDPGSEVAWLQERASAIAINFAEHNKFIPTADAALFHPPWPIAIRGGWKAMWSRGTRPRTYTCGFAVLPAASVPAAKPTTAAAPVESP